MDHLVSDIGDNFVEKYNVLSENEVQLKMKTFRNLCLGNKINANNAFDIDMIGYFSTWLAKKNAMENVNVESFQEIADYLDASEKVYGLRVDNFSLETSKLVEEFRTIYLKKAMLNMENENELLKMPKPKRPKIMLTSADKLKCKTTDSDDFVDPSVKQEIFNFNFNELFESNRPSNYLLSFYHSLSFKEEKQIKKGKQLKNDDQYFFTMHNLENELTKREICSEYSNFVTEKDNANVSSEKELDIEGIENHFDPEDNVFQTSFLDDENIQENDSSSNNDSHSEIAALIECVDNVKRDYSFFNPQRLANWNGPKLWKAETMAKALKSCNPSERKEIFSNASVSDDIEELIDEQKTKPVNKKRLKKKKDDDDAPIKWRTRLSIEKEEIIRIKSKEKISPRTMNKWDPADNVIDTKSIIGHISHKFEFMKYDEVLPDWRIAEETKGKRPCEDSPDQQSVYDCDFGADNDDNDNGIPDDELLSMVNTFQKDMMDLSKSYKAIPANDLVQQLKSESTMDIAELKKEISKIIDQECIDTGSDNKWSKKMFFSNLLCTLNVSKREDLSISIVFVGLLHLTNERGLKLSEEPNNEIGEMDLGILKPLNKM